MFIYDNVYSQVAIIRIEKQRQKIRRNALRFLNKNCKHPILVFPKNKVFNYSITKQDITDLGYSEGCVIATTLRNNEDLNKKYNLNVFNMLVSFSSIDNNIKTFFKFLKDFCKADMSTLGIVSITNKNKLGIAGIEPYLSKFYKYGIKKQNILIRKDVEEAFKAGDGDGYWVNKIKPKYQGSSFSVYVPLKDCADIKNYSQTKEWLEVGECGIKGTFDDVGIGMERIEFYFFGKQFPRNK
jgi:hypothetical protein